MVVVALCDADEAVVIETCVMSVYLRPPVISVTDGGGHRTFAASRQRADGVWIYRQQLT